MSTSTSPSPSLWTSMFSKRPVVKRRDSTASEMTSASKDTINPATKNTTPISSEEDTHRPAITPSSPAFGGSYRLQTFDSNIEIEEPTLSSKKQKRTVFSLFGSKRKNSIVINDDDEDLGSIPSLSSSASFSSSSSSSLEEFIPLPIERLSSYKHHFTIRGQAIIDESDNDRDRTSFDSPRKMHFWERNPIPAVLNMVPEPDFDDEVIDWSAESNQGVYLGRV